LPVPVTYLLEILKTVIAHELNDEQ
jgi:hypothetical protein